MSDDSRKKNRPDVSSRADTAPAGEYGYGREPESGTENTPADAASKTAGRNADGSPRYDPRYDPWSVPSGPAWPPYFPLPGQYAQYGPQPCLWAQPFPGFQPAMPGQAPGFSPAAFDPYGFSGMPGAPYYQYAPQYDPRYASQADQEPAGTAPQEAPCDAELSAQRYAQAMELCGDLMQGRTDPAKIMDFITGSGSHFWKGAAVGAAVAFLATNENVREAIGNALSGIFGKNDESAE